MHVFKMVGIYYLLGKKRREKKAERREQDQ